MLYCTYCVVSPFILCVIKQLCDCRMRATGASDYIVSPHVGFMSFCDTLLLLWLDVWLYRMWLTRGADATRCCLQQFVKDEWDRMRAGSASTAQRLWCCPHSAASQDSVSLVSSAVSSTIWTSEKTEISFASMMNWLCGDRVLDHDASCTWKTFLQFFMSTPRVLQPCQVSFVSLKLFALAPKLKNQFLNATSISRTDD